MRITVEVRRRAAWGTIFIGLLLLASACADRQRRNPLDPSSQGAPAAPGALTVRAGAGHVQLQWDYSTFQDIEGFQIYRRLVGNDFSALLSATLSADSKSYVDNKVENDLTYDYILALMVQNEGERLTEPVRRATPGTEIPWLVDAGTGLVWQLAPDGRAAVLSVGVFPNIVAAALDGETGRLWVSDRYAAGVQRVATDGSLVTLHADLAESTVLSMDTPGLGWIVDGQRREVVFFAVNDRVDTLVLSIVDAHFSRVSSIAAIGRRCWIADHGAGRVLLYDAERKGIVVEYPGLESPVAIAATTGRAWVLTDEGRALMCLDTLGVVQRVALPFDRGKGLDVEQEFGAVWVVGDTDVAVFDDGGVLIQHWVASVSEGRFIAVDQLHATVWLASRSAVWKFTSSGELLLHMGGFSRLEGVVINPGKG